MRKRRLCGGAELVDLAAVCEEYRSELKRAKGLKRTINPEHKHMEEIAADC